MEGADGHKVTGVISAETGVGGCRGTEGQQLLGCHHTYSLFSLVQTMMERLYL